MFHLLEYSHGSLEQNENDNIVMAMIKFRERTFADKMDMKLQKDVSKVRDFIYSFSGHNHVIMKVYFVQDVGKVHFLVGNSSPTWQTFTL